MAIHSSILVWQIPWQRSLVGYRSRGCKELDMTQHTHTHLAHLGPLQQDHKKPVLKRLPFKCWKVKWTKRLGRNPDFRITWILPYVNEVLNQTLHHLSPWLISAQFWNQESTTMLIMSLSWKGGRILKCSVYGYSTLNPPDLI